MSDYLDFPGAPGLLLRGTVIVVPGRGETAAAYERFGRRLAADAYQIRVLPKSPAPGAPDVTLPDLEDALAAAVSDLGGELARPLILVGVDAAAAAVAALVARSTTESVWWPQAVVLAGLPGYGAHDLGSDWEAELEVRTHCPTHRGVLTSDADVRRGSLGAALADELLDLAYSSTVDVPHLLLIGDSDPLADRDALAAAAKSLPAARLSVVRAGHHDILNDAQHRSVAAEVVSFLETVRAGAPLQPFVTVESSAW